MDELTTTGPSYVAELDGGAVRCFEVSPGDVGLATASLDDLKGGDAEHNAAAIRAVLDGEPGPFRDIVVYNAGAFPGAPVVIGADSSWGIQVGAYYRYKPAKRAAVAAAKRFPGLLEDTRVMITHVKGQRGRIYRSRLVGLTEAKARTACRRLEKAKVDCLVIRVGRKIALAS